MVRTFSIGIRNGPVERPLRHRHVLVDRVEQVDDPRRPLRVALQRPQAGHPDDRGGLAVEAVAVEQLTHLQLHQVEQLRVRHRSALLSATTTYGTPILLASTTCSRVCGIVPSSADTTRIAPSSCAAPVIMFFT